MRVGEYFKRKRIERGLDLKQLAKLIRDDFQESDFYDFENGDDNDIDGWSIVDFKRYCAEIGVSPTEFADIPISDISGLPLGLLVKTRRTEKRLSIEDLSELIGFYPDVIEAIENDKKDVVVCLAALRGLAKELDIPFRLFLEKI
jgi:transcriptional regulator with XRE-family HTH domain